MGGIGISGSFNQGDYAGPASLVITKEANAVGASTSLITKEANAVGQLPISAQIPKEANAVGKANFLITKEANAVGASTSLITMDANRASLSSFINIIKSVRTIGFSLPFSPVVVTRRRSAVF